MILKIWATLFALCLIMFFFFSERDFLVDTDDLSYNLSRRNKVLENKKLPRARKKSTYRAAMVIVTVAALITYLWMSN